MHELPVTESILAIATRHAAQAHAAAVTDIHLVIGQLSSIIDDSIQFYWDLLKENTTCQSAILHFHRIPAKFSCQDCGQAFQLDTELAPCPHCGGLNIRVVAGEEFYVESIEIECQ